MTTRRERDALDPDVVQPLPEFGEECFWCQGTGASADGWACSSCDGTGWCPWPSGAHVIWRPDLLEAQP